MSTAPYLTLISELLPVQRRDFYMADAGLLNPNNSNPVLDGEWLSLNTAGKLVRGSGTLGTRSWQLFAERGRYDTQAIGKAPLLFIGQYEAECSIVTIGSLDVGHELVVGDVDVGGLTKKGLIKLPATAGTYWVVGTVTKMPGGGKVRYLTTGYKIVVPA